MEYKEIDDNTIEYETVKETVKKEFTFYINIYKNGDAEMYLDKAEAMEQVGKMGESEKITITREIKE